MVQQLSVNEASPGAMAPGELRRVCRKDFDWSHQEHCERTHGTMVPSIAYSRTDRPTFCFSGSFWIVLAGLTGRSVLLGKNDCNLQNCSQVFLALTNVPDDKSHSSWHVLGIDKCSRWQVSFILTCVGHWQMSQMTSLIHLDMFWALTNVPDDKSHSSWHVLCIGKCSRWQVSFILSCVGHWQMFLMTSLIHLDILFWLVQT